MSLYLTYRPKDFDDLVGQGFIKKALTAALAQDKTVGAYLFYGSRGTGKTSVARIFAKAINCFNRREDWNPCDTCEMCTAFRNGSLLDIIEIDGASNNGVANVRELIEKAKFLPSIGKKKVYIIDEVHMLSIGAFNALLKILEEPPEHVIFILATTELHKIPETIISRTQRFDFRKIAENDIKDRLKYVAKKEGIEAEDGAIALLAKLARWGLRDALSLFEQYTVANTLSLEFLEQNLSLIGEELLVSLFDAIVQKNGEKVRNILDTIKQNSSDPRRFLEQCLYFLREKAYREMGTDAFKSTWQAFQVCTDAYRKLKDFPDGFLLVEVSLLGLLSGVTVDLSQTWKTPVVSTSVSSQASRSASVTVAWNMDSVQHTVVQTAPVTQSPVSKKVPVSNVFDGFPVDTTDYGSWTDEFFDVPVVKSVQSAGLWTKQTTNIHAVNSVKSVEVSFEDSAPSVPKILGAKKPFSLPELIAFIRTIPRTALLVAKLKSCTYSWNESTTTFALTLPNEFDKKMIDKVETREILARGFWEVFGTEVELAFLLPGQKVSITSHGGQWLSPEKSSQSPTDLHPDDISDVF